MDLNAQRTVVLVEVLVLANCFIRYLLLAADLRAFYFVILAAACLVAPSAPLIVRVGSNMLPQCVCFARARLPPDCTPLPARKSGLATRSSVFPTGKLVPYSTIRTTQSRSSRKSWLGDRATCSRSTQKRTQAP